MRAIRNKGCGDKFEIKCENCKEIGIGDQGASFYDPTENLIVLCEDRVRLSTREVIVNTSHELVHAFDFCRVRYLIFYYFIFFLLFLSLLNYYFIIIIVIIIYYYFSLLLFINYLSPFIK